MADNRNSADDALPSPPQPGQSGQPEASEPVRESSTSFDKESAPAGDEGPADKKSSEESEPVANTIQSPAETAAGPTPAELALQKNVDDVLGSEVRLCPN